MVALALCVFSAPVWASDQSTPAAPGGDKDRDVAVERRVPWRGSKIKGSPDPPAPYTVEPAFPHLKFNFPVVLVPAAGTNRLFLGELKGRIYSFPEDPGCTKADLALDLAKLHPDFTAFYGLVFHPQFDENRYVYRLLRPEERSARWFGRFPVHSQPHRPAGDRSRRASRYCCKFWSGGHNGGCLDFGNDGYLYISTGDGAVPSPPDPMKTGQDCSDLLSSVLRIDVDHPEPGKAYRIPADNPFVNTPGVRPEIWAFGFRNPWKMSIDQATGDLWVGDVGWELWEMVYKVKRGGNYGWSVMEGPQPVHVEGRRGPTPILPPIKAHPHSEAASITGGYVYHGTRLPELAGTYIYGDYHDRNHLGAAGSRGTRSRGSSELARTPLHLVAFGESNSGELYLLDHDRTHQIYRLVRNPAATAVSRLPAALSQTGLFASTRDQQPAPGVIPYSVNAELWADGATAERFLAVPGTDASGSTTRETGGFPMVPSWSAPSRSNKSRVSRPADGGGNPDPSPRGRRLAAVFLCLERRPDRRRSWPNRGGSTGPWFEDPSGGRRERQLPRPCSDRMRALPQSLGREEDHVYGIQSASPLGVNTPQLNRRRESWRTSPQPVDRCCTSSACSTGRPSPASCPSWSILTTSRPTWIAGPGPISRPTAPIATNSTPADQPTSH